MKSFIQKLPLAILLLFCLSSQWTNAIQTLNQNQVHNVQSHVPQHLNYLMQQDDNCSCCGDTDCQCCPPKPIVFDVDHEHIVHEVSEKKKETPKKAKMEAPKPQKQKVKTVTTVVTPPKYAPVLISHPD